MNLSICFFCPIGNEPFCKNEKRHSLIITNHTNEHLDSGPVQIENNNRVGARFNQLFCDRRPDKTAVDMRSNDPKRVFVPPVYVPTRTE